MTKSEFILVLLIFGHLSTVFGQQDIFGPSINQIKYGVVTDEICSIPQHKMAVQYASGYKVLEGNFIPPQALLDPPYVQVPDANSPDLYLIMLLNPDYPTSRNAFFGSDYIHWLVVNVPGTAVDLGQTILPYQKLSVGPNTGYHRYIFLYYKQRGPINIQTAPARTYFSSFDFVRDFGINTEPFAANFLISSDDLVPATPYLPVTDTFGGDFKRELTIGSEREENDSQIVRNNGDNRPYGGFPPTNQQQGNYGPTSNLYKYLIIGDILCRKPPYKMQVFYPSGYKVLEGNYIPNNAADTAPLVWVPKALPPYLYTILMIDPDYPTPDSPAPYGYVHWCVVNIPGSAIDQGTTVLEYQGPNIQPNTGNHRQLFLYLRQNGGPVNVPTTLARVNFGVSNFARTYNMDTFATNFFITFER